MATTNEREFNKELVNAYGGTGSTINERAARASLIAAIKAGGVVSTKPAVVALTNASASHTINATFSNTEVKAALDALGAKINTVIAALKA